MFYIFRVLDDCVVDFCLLNSEMILCVEDILNYVMHSCLNCLSVDFASLQRNVLRF
jgi:hypothetical protein